jgi:glycosyltransferase involved in cell wall biosynthesis
MKISIITPVKNRKKFIQGCIDSVASQTYVNFEHIIVDGMSTDGTLDIIKKNKKINKKNIRFISEDDASVGEAWNKGLSMVSGDVIGWLGADDRFSENNILEIISNYFKNNPMSFVVYGGCNFINENGELYGKSEEYKYDFNTLLNKGNYIPATSLFFRKSVADKIGFLDSYGNDFDYILRIAQQYKIHSIKKILSDFILATDSETGDLVKYIKVLKLDWNVSKKYGGSSFNNYHRRYLFYSFISVIHLANILNYIKNKRRKNI